MNKLYQFLLVISIVIFILCFQIITLNAQNGIIKTIPGGITIEKESSLRRHPDSNSKLIKTIDYRTPFIITEQKSFNKLNRTYYWYKVLLNDNTTSGWMISKECRVGETDSNDFVKSDYSGLYYSVATNLLCRNCYDLPEHSKDYYLADTLFQTLLEIYSDKQIPFRDENDEISYKNCKIGVLQNLAILYFFKKEYHKSIGILNKLLIQKEATKEDILSSKLRMMDIYLENLQDTMKTLEMCHDIITHHPNEELVYFEINYWGDIRATETIVKTLSNPETVNRLKEECQKILTETTNPPVILLSYQGIVKNYIYTKQFNLAKAEILRIIKKYPDESRTYFKTDLNYPISLLSSAIECMIKNYGDYIWSLDLLEKVKNTTNDSVILFYSNYKIAQLSDEANGDREKVLELYKNLNPKMYLWDPIFNVDICLSSICTRIDEINSYEVENVSLIENAVMKPGLYAKSDSYKYLQKGTLAKKLYDDDSIVEFKGRYGSWAKIKLDNGEVRWVFNYFISPLNKMPIFIPQKNTEPIWLMEGANSNRTGDIDNDMIKNPELIKIIHNISGEEIVFSDINTDLILDIIGYSSKGLTIVDGMTQKIIWVFNCSNGSIPVVNDSSIYITATKKDSVYLFALNKSTGFERWSVLIGTSTFEGVYSSPAIFNNLIYISTIKKGILAFELHNGVEVWEYPLNYPCLGSITSTPKFVYFISRDSFDGNDLLFALDAVTGKLKWKFDFLHRSNSGKIEGVVINKDKLFCGGGNEFLYAINANSGKLIWRTQIRKKDWSFTSCRPSIQKGIVYYNSPADTEIYAINCSTGTIKWKYHYSHSFQGRSAIVNDALYIRSDDSYLHAISIKKGELIWKYKIGSHAYGGANSVSIAQGKIFISSTDDNLYIIGKKGTK
jgi:outer membrane protein assembly factor BamB